ncbi:class I SAM-dependent methyltransferase [Sphingosinicella rhizophila]|uniref:Methyltransferase domain-containing protein n=1 Tax=Sphingosinicella rhizophila TaxID=3050082 RepID=A0ABU3QA58_9SPHN|nr:methyltransferase domain-containing protein [Sphingosinicella sp. GR2756]MDT9599830.1 methyltransferase domain-containing protein [Sphingosinicella sp. GR2756]
MRQSLVAAFSTILLLGTAACAPVERDGGSASRALETAVAASTRTPANVARDRYRHPVETLRYFGVRPSDTVVEIWPGGGWYTEILAPYLASGGGTLWAVAPEWGMGGIKKLKAANPALYDGVRTATFPRFEAGEQIVPDGTADVVLTFRNVHNWRMGYRNNEQDYGEDAFRQIYRMLKPGGVLGIVDHRLPENASADREKKSGYIKVSTVRRLAEAAGFRLAGSSEINANPRDSADWPDGVWTLPPSLALEAKDREKYVAIGESDRMTLKFVKPE